MLNTFNFWGLSLVLKRYDFTKTNEDSYFISIDVTKLFVFSYNLVFFLVTYLLPMVGMILCYLQMGLHLWQGDRETIGSVPQHPAMVKSRQNKKRVSNSGAHESNF